MIAAEHHACVTFTSPQRSGTPEADYFGLSPEAPAAPPPLPAAPSEGVEGGAPVVRRFKNLLSRSNQNGAPSDMAIAVNSQPPDTWSHSP